MDLCWLSLVLALAVPAAALVAARWLFASRRASSKAVVAFFHPYWCVLLALQDLGGAAALTARVQQLHNAGGGGERVLWCGLAALKSLRHGSQVKVIIYCGDNEIVLADMLAHVRKTFGIEIDTRRVDLQVVKLAHRRLLEASLYPRFTMLGQSLGSALVALEALWRSGSPDVWVDTTGCPFTYPVAKLLGGCRVVAYTHYPTITTDMIQRVQSRRPTYNNEATVTGSTTATTAKLLYYWLFSLAYCAAGGFVDTVMVNSSWTAGHIKQLWDLPTGEGVYAPANNPIAALLRAALAPVKVAWRVGRSLCGGGAAAASTSSADGSSRPFAAALSGLVPRPVAQIVYPPCNTEVLAALPLGYEAGTGLPTSVRERLVVSVAQFRPEKDHALQLRAFAAFRARNPAAYDDVKLALIGGARDAGDRGRVEELKRLAVSLGLMADASTASDSDAASFHVNVTLTQLRSWLGRASLGLHTMWNEHFGIGIVEMMAAGVVPIAHDSGGPRADIVVPFPLPGTEAAASASSSSRAAPTGFLAATVTQYADALEAAFYPTVWGRPVPAVPSDAVQASASEKSGESDASGEPAEPEGAATPETSSSSSSSSSAASPPPVPACVDPSLRLGRLAAAGRVRAAGFSDGEFSLAFFACMVHAVRDALTARGLDVLAEATAAEEAAAE